MVSVKCEVQKILEGDPIRVVRIRAAAFQNKKDKSEQCIRFIVQIKNKQGNELLYLEAEYADDNYIKRLEDKGRKLSQNDLIFISELYRKKLDVKPSERGVPQDWVEVQEVMLQSEFAVHGALSEDFNEGRIWIRPSQDTVLYKEIKDRRRLVRIKRSSKSVYSEALYADPFYMASWKKKGINFGDSGPDYNVIFISAWYRRLLDLENVPAIIDDLDVKPLHPLDLRALLFRYPRNHPQALVLGTSMMGIIGFGLGVLGTGLGFIGIKDWLATFFSPLSMASPFLGAVFVVVGFVITLLGVIGLIRR